MSISSSALAVPSPFSFLVDYSHVLECGKLIENLFGIGEGSMRIPVLEMCVLGIISGDLDTKITAMAELESKREVDKRDNLTSALGLAWKDGLLHANSLKDQVRLFSFHPTLEHELYLRYRAQFANATRRFMKVCALDEGPNITTLLSTVLLTFDRYVNQLRNEKIVFIYTAYTLDNEKATLLPDSGLIDEGSTFAGVQNYSAIVLFGRSLQHLQKLPKSFAFGQYNEEGKSIILIHLIDKIATDVGATTAAVPSAPSPSVPVRASASATATTTASTTSDDLPPPPSLSSPPNGTIEWAQKYSQNLYYVPVYNYGNNVVDCSSLLPFIRHSDFNSLR